MKEIFKIRAEIVQNRTNMSWSDHNRLNELTDDPGSTLAQWKHLLFKVTVLNPIEKIRSTDKAKDVDWYGSYHRIKYYKKQIRKARWAFFKGEFAILSMFAFFFLIPIMTIDDLGSKILAFTPQTIAFLVFCFVFIYLFFYTHLKEAKKNIFEKDEKINHLRRAIILARNDLRNGTKYGEKEDWPKKILIDSNTIKDFLKNQEFKELANQLFEERRIEKENEILELSHRLELDKFLMDVTELKEKFETSTNNN